MTYHDDFQDDLQPVIEQLRAHRPEATPLELDSVKQRVRGRSARPAGKRARSATFMKSRLAILGMLVTGMFLSTAGAGLAISGLSGSKDASVAQYGPGVTNTTPPVPITQESAPGGGEDGGGAVLPEQSANNPGSGGGGDLQPSRQVEAGADTGGGGSELPFTGFAAIPILIGGVALLSGGLVMRRRSAED